MYGKCTKCGNMAEVRRHHYKGYNTDDTSYYCRSCDLKAHHNTRRLGLCTLTHEQAQRKSALSYNRTTSKRMDISSMSFGKNTLLYEQLFININTNHITICSGFFGNHGYKLYELKGD